MSRRQMRQLQGNRIAMVFQDPMMTLNPVLRIGEQMVEAIRAHERGVTPADIALLGIMLKRGSAEAEPAEAEG